MKFTTKCKTDGHGFWNNKQKDVSLTEILLKPKSGELQVYFDKSTWDVMKDGLIYTDINFLKELQYELVSKLGFSAKAVKTIDYSEQGMQGDDYISFDVGDLFVEEYKRKQNPH